jgi:alpha-amylase
MDANENLLSPIFNADGTCKREIGWICEHRWSAITRMISWRNAVRGADVQNWWDNGNNKMGFGRGNRGFILFNVDWGDLNETLQTGLPGGQYCDVVSGMI